MKKCPVCKSKVDEEFECPICYTTLTNEPLCYGGREECALNKYFVRYLVRQCWFSAVSLLVVLVAAFFTDPSRYQFCVLTGLLAVFSGVMGAFQRKWIKVLQYKYTEEYASFRVVIGKYMAAGLAIFAAIFMAVLGV